ncbi:MAG: ABC transporter permease subunit [Verrucomicrobiia bacterium]|jgi:ABC-type transport system involved in multi-copper enzyme maturation permease subunit
MSTAPIQPDVVYFNLGRVWTMALNTLIEMTRQKVFYFMIVFALLMIGAASFFSIFSFGEEAQYITQLKFIKDTGLGAISVFGAIIAVVATAQLLPAELENRTIYTILAKPVHRLEFLLGKFVGVALLLAISVTLMGSLFLGVVFIKDQHLSAATYHETVEAAEGAVAGSPDLKPEAKQKVLSEAQKRAEQGAAEIHKTAGYRDIVKAMTTTLFKLLLVAAITLMLSSFATSMVFTVVMSAMLYFSGHLVPVAQNFYATSKAPLGKLMAGIVNWIVPNLAAFDVADDLFAGDPLSWLKVLKILSYGLFYLIVMLTLAHLIFREREI